MAIYIRLPSIEFLIKKESEWRLSYEKEVRDICNDYEIQVGKLMIQISTIAPDTRIPKSLLIELG